MADLMFSRFALLVGTSIQESLVFRCHSPVDSETIMHVIWSLGLLLLVACSQSSGVSKLGPDMYITSAAASPSTGASEAQRLALSEANEYCVNMGKNIMVMRSSDVIDSYGGGRSKVTFRCLAKDPALPRQ